jgi:hypothetical protein
VKAATFALSLVISGDGQNLTWAPPAAIGNASSPAQVLTVALISGKVEVALPAGCVGFVLAPSPNSVVQKSMAFASTDAGGPISTAYPSPYDWVGSSAPPANVWFTANAPESATLYCF